MGYCSNRNIPGRTTLQMLDLYANYRVGHVTTNGNGDTHEIIEAHQGTGGAWFIIRWTFNGTGQTFDYAQFVKCEREAGEFYWKSISEFSGPYYISMPRAMFNRLTPLDQYPGDANFAVEWRARQQAEYGIAKLTKALAPKVGEVIVFAEPLNFPAVNAKVARFRVEEWGRKRRVVALKDDGTSFLAKLSRYAWASPYTIEGRPVPAMSAVKTPLPSVTPAPEQVTLF